MKILSPHTIGDDDPRPGISIFHRMFFVSLHSIGGFAVRDTPVMSGPRHCPQFLGSPTEAWTVMVQQSRADKASRIRMVWILSWPSSRLLRGTGWLSD
jgi:hypothetical protein